MTTLDTTIAPTRNWTYWLGWVLSGLVIAFLLFDSIIKLVPLDVVVETMNGLGYPPETARTIGILTLVSTVLYAIPRTSVLGAILLTAILGGAVATNLRVFTPLFSHTLFGVYLGLFVWGGLWFRDERLRALLPLRR